MKKILLAEDDSWILEKLGSMFEEQGFAVTAVGNGAALLDIVDAVKPDVIVTDNTMPNLCGIEVLRQLRSTPARAHYPVVVYSGNDAIAAEVLSLGGKFVTKGNTFALIETACALAG